MTQEGETEPGPPPSIDLVTDDDVEEKKPFKIHPSLMVLVPILLLILLAFILAIIKS